MFNQKLLYRYPHPREVVFDNGSDYNQEFTPLLKDFSVTPICTSINNPPNNTPVERIHKLLYKIIVSKDLDSKVYDYIYPWG